MAIVNNELLTAIQVYFDAIYYCDATKIDQVFHPASSLFDVDEGKVLADPIASFRHDVDTRPSPASKDQPREETVISIDFLCANCAVVKLRLRAHENIFVDHLSFVNGEHGWQIVAKVWHLEAVKPR